MEMKKYKLSDVLAARTNNKMLKDCSLELRRKTIPQRAFAVRSANSYHELLQTIEDLRAELAELKRQIDDGEIIPYAVYIEWQNNLCNLTLKEFARRKARKETAKEKQK